MPFALKVPRYHQFAIPRSNPGSQCCRAARITSLDDKISEQLLPCVFLTRGKQKEFIVAGMVSEMEHPSLQAALHIKILLTEWLGSQTEWNISPIFFAAEKT